MKDGIGLEQLTGEVMRQARSREDFLFSTPEMKITTGMVSEAGSLWEPASLLFTPAGQFGLTDFALEQLATQVGLPRSYLRKLQESNINLLDLNLNTLLMQTRREKLVRVLDGEVRAVLSNRYKRLDNDSLLEALWPVFDDLGGLSVGSSDLSPRRMVLKMVSPRLKGDVRVNDPVQAGLVISNSEVGCGAVTIELLIFRLICTNGAIIGKGMGKTRKYHIGQAIQGHDGNSQMTIPEADSTLIWDEVRAAVKSFLHEDSFQSVLEMMQVAATQKIEADVEMVTARIADRHSLNENEQGEVLSHLTESGDMTRYGLANAITRMSQDVKNYERATELERLGGHLLSLSPREWNGLSMN